MLNLKEVAAEQVRQAIAAQGESEGYTGIRVAVVGGGCSGFQYSMKLEKDGRDGDRIVDVNGFKVYVDEQSRPYLEGVEIDYVETAQGAGFKFNNPNVRGTCGCGESFHA